MRSILLLLAFICAPVFCWATKISGSITSTNGELLPYTAVTVKEFRKGCVANENGKFIMDLPEGKYSLEFRFIGYKTLVEVIEVKSEPIKLDVKLEELSRSTKEVSISAVDPANRIMRKAISKRSYYLDQIKNFKSRIYVKGVNRLLSYPKSILGKKIEYEKQDTISNGVIYLSESTSDYYFSRKLGTKEVMLASKVSGEPKGLSFNNYQMIRIPLYYSKYVIPSAKRPVISPLADNAFFYYKFELEDEFIDNGITVYKIKISPRRKIDPALNGFIYIQEGSWRIHGADFYALHSTGLELIDTLRIKQTMIPVNDSMWMPAMEQLYFHASLLSLKINGNYTASLSNYDVNPVFNQELFEDKVMLRIDTGLNKFSDKYWDSIRTVPLTEIEVKDYRLKDSLYAITQTKGYKDSLERKRRKVNRFWKQAGKTMGLFHSVNFTADSGKVQYGWKEGFAALKFSAVEGFAIESPFYISKGKGRLVLRPEFAFGPKAFYMDGGFSYNRKEKKQVFNFTGGNSLAQFSGVNPVSRIDNMAMSLSAKRNLIQLYQKAFGKIDFKQKLSRGLSIQGDIEFARRSRVYVNSDFSFFLKDRPYGPNDPLIGNRDYTDYSFLPHNALVISGSFEWQPSTYGFMIGGEEINVGSKWPKFFGGYRKGISGVFNSQVNYDLVYAGLNKNFSLGLLGKSSISASGGTFLNHKQVQFMDAVHFLGNNGNVFFDARAQRFLTMPYYKYSTQSSYVQAHVFQDFSGFFFNKIPLIRKLKFTELVGVSVLYSGNNEPYYECRLGVGNILKVISVYYGTSIGQDGGNYHQIGIVLPNIGL